MTNGVVDVAAEDDETLALFRASHFGVAPQPAARRPDRPVPEIRGKHLDAEVDTLREIGVVECDGFPHVTFRRHDAYKYYHSSAQDNTHSLWLSAGEPPDPSGVVANVQKRVSAFGARLRALRKARGWSQEELSARCSLHWTYLGGIERGERNPSLRNVFKIADALGVAVREIFDE